MKRPHSILAGALLSVPALVPCAVAQVSVAPSAVEASVPGGQTVEVALTVANGGADTLAFALSLAPAPSADDPPKEPGEVLFTTEDWYYGLSTLTVLPNGNVLAADTWRDFFEFTADLAFVHEFEHYYEDFGSATLGVTYNGDSESLWWLDVLKDCDGPTCTIEHALLIEGDLDGQATGRTLAVPWVEDATCGRVGTPARPAYADDAGLFFWLDILNYALWAMDTTGAVVEGYPVALSDYAGVAQPYNPGGCLVVSGLDAHALGGESVLETVTGYPFVHPRNRQYTVVVLDRWGRNRGAETPLFELPTPDGYGEVLSIRDVVRSRTDPSVLYLTVWTGFLGDVRDWVYAVRAVPLPPVWLHASPILFAVEPESEEALTLTLDASGLEVGVYKGVASVRAGNGIGPVLVEVPVTLTVTPATASEEGPEATASRLGTPYPSPSSGRVTVPLMLEEVVEVRVSVFDVLGREVAVLHDGRLSAGEHELHFDGAGLPAGVYLVRSVGDSFSAVRRITLLR